MDALEKSLWGIWKDATRHSSWSFCCSKRNSKTFQRQLISVTASALDREFSEAT
jgi:hypothetical protein